MGFLSSKDTGTLSLVLDISSGSTAAALVRNFKSGLPEMLGNSRTPFFINGKPTAETLESAMLSSLSVTLSQISKSIAQVSGHIDKVLVTFSSPWVSSHLKTVIINKEEGFVFSEKMLRAVIDEERELFISKMGENFKDEGEVFESTVTNLYLNGYEAIEPVKDKVKKVELSFLLSAISKELLWKIENVIIRSVGVKKGLVLHSFIYVFYKALSHSFKNLHSALLLNITSELTDTLFLRHGNSALSASLPFGPASIGREVADRLGVSEVIANSYLSLFTSGALDQSTTEAVDTILMGVEEKWNALWKSMGESIPEGSSIPYSIFLLAPAGSEKLMKTFLEGVFEGKSIILLGETNAFTKELVKVEEKNIVPDENLLVLSSFSNLLK